VDELLKKFIKELRDCLFCVEKRDCDFEEPKNLEETNELSQR